MVGQVHAVQPGWMSYAATIGLVAVVIALRLRRMSKTRPLNLASLWIVPAVYAVIAAVVIIASPPTVLVVVASLIALVIGAALGWTRGRMIHIAVDAQTGVLNQKASPAALFLLVAIIVVRAGARGILGENGISPAMLTDPLIAFALGLLTLTRVEMYLRAKRLVEEARSSR